MKKTRVTRLCRLALLCALAIALSALEGIFTPLLPPFVKAGLSNVAVMLAAAFLGGFFASPAEAEDAELKALNSSASLRGARLLFSISTSK